VTGIVISSNLVKPWHQVAPNNKRATLHVHRPFIDALSAYRVVFLIWPTAIGLNLR
jgi:hypothetical protein